MCPQTFPLNRYKRKRQTHARDVVLVVVKRVVAKVVAVKEKERNRARRKKKESTERDCVLSRRFDRVPVGFGFLQRLIR